MQCSIKTISRYIQKSLKANFISLQQTYHLFRGLRKLASMLIYKNEDNSL